MKFSVRVQELYTITELSRSCLNGLIVVYDQFHQSQEQGRFWNITMSSVLIVYSPPPALNICLEFSDDNIFEAVSFPTHKFNLNN